MDQIPTFCINLASEPERWDRMKARGHRLGWNIQRFEAITPETLDDLPFKESLRPNERACANSHYRLWKYQVDHDIPVLCILEDDVLFHERVNELLTEGFKQSWLCIMLNNYEPTELNTWSIARDQCLAGAYILRKAAAEFLLALIDVTRLWAADGMLICMQNNLASTWVHFPWLAIQENLTSSVRPEQRGVDENRAKVAKILSSYGLTTDLYT